MPVHRCCLCSSLGGWGPRFGLVWFGLVWFGLGVNLKKENIAEKWQDDEILLFPLSDWIHEVGETVSDPPIVSKEMRVKWLQKWSNTMLGIVSVSVWKQQTSKWNGCIAERGLDDPEPRYSRRPRYRGLSCVYLLLCYQWRTHQPFDTQINLSCLVVKRRLDQQSSCSPKKHSDFYSQCWLLLYPSQMVSL